MVTTFLAVPAGLWAYVLPPHRSSPSKSRGMKSTGGTVLSMLGLEYRETGGPEHARGIHALQVMLNSAFNRARDWLFNCVIYRALLPEHA